MGWFKYGPSRALGTTVVLLLICFTLCSCVPKKKAASRLKVVASVPVIYDWTRNLMDEPTNTNLFLNLIIKNGLNYHNLIPGVTEENLINSADLLIYIGGPSEKWIDEIVAKKSTENSDRLVLKLSDFITSNQDADFDEHCIISPSVAQICCQKIFEYLCKLDSPNEQNYMQYFAKYSELLSILDSTYKLQSQKTQNQTFIICDRMPFKAIFNEYGFNYVAVYDSCPAPQNEKLNIENLKQFGTLIDSTGTAAVYVFEDSDKKLAKQVIGNSKNPKCDTLVFDSMESLTLSQLFSGKNYLDIMRNNLTLLRPN